jgi:exopolyphosphatase/pppGpp-phosphohydrolase
MKLFNFSFLIRKPIKVPATNETKLVESVQVWTVRWKSRYGEFSTNVREEVVAFVDEQEAEDFKKSIENAFNLLRHTSGTTVTITKEN